MKKLRIGFLSTAGIGRKNWKAIFNSGNAVVSAVASRNIEKSLKYIEDCQRDHPFAETPRAFGSYEELISSSEVDAVYVPLPTGLRKEFVLRAAAAGKHILCEKPCAASIVELEEMLFACRNNSVQFMDGVMFMHNPRLEKVRAVLDEQANVGRIRRISSAFSFYARDEIFFRENIRTDGALEPAGCLGDLGWYSIRFALWTLNWQLPHTVTGKILAQSAVSGGRTPAPTEFSGELFFADGVSVGFYSSFLTGRQQWVHVSGQNGWLRLPDFVHPFNGYKPAFEVNEKVLTVAGDVKCPPGTDPMGFGHPTAQDTRMWRNFANQIASGKLNDDWPQWARQTQKVLDACLEAGRSGKTFAL
jgi:predicted dehydrogenase